MAGLDRIQVALAHDRQTSDRQHCEHSRCPQLPCAESCLPYRSLCLHTRVSASPGPQTQTAISTSASLDCIVTDWRCHNKPWCLIHAPVQTISASSHLLFVPSLDIDSSTAEPFCLGDGIDDPRQAGVPDTRVEPPFQPPTLTPSLILFPVLNTTYDKTRQTVFRESISCLIAGFQFGNCLVVTEPTSSSKHSPPTWRPTKNPLPMRVTAKTL